jgi:hypothetical protein
MALGWVEMWEKTMVPLWVRQSALGWVQKRVEQKEQCWARRTALQMGQESGTQSVRSLVCQMVQTWVQEMDFLWAVVWGSEMAKMKAKLLAQEKALGSAQAWARKMENRWVQSKVSPWV